VTDLLGIPPQPVPDFDSEKFWESTAEGRLALCRCQACGCWLQPPLERCRRCAGETAFEEVSGQGSVYSFIVVRQPSVPGYLEDLPYVVAVVELPEQKNLRLPARLVDVEPEAVRVGIPVQVAFQPLPGGPFVVPVFRPA
jgi:uncharacterized protein